MKKLNIFCIAAAMTCLTLPCTAGTPEGKIAFNPEPSDNRPFGISVGLVTKQISDGSTKTPWMMLDQIATGKMDKKSSPSFQIGFSWSPEFRYGIGLQTGIFYELSVDSYSISETIMGESISSKLKLDEHTLSIPVRVQYRYEIIPDLSVFIYTGPSFDISLAYNATAEMSAMGISESEKDNLYSDSDNNQFHLMWGAGAGVRWKFLQLNIGGDWGLTPLYKSESSAHLNKPFHITLSYRF